MLFVCMIAGSLPLFAWVYLSLGRGRFWKTDQHLPPYTATYQSSWPSVAVIIPARNEAEILPQTLPTMLRQDYAGQLHVFVVDDNSSDNTGAIAHETAVKLGAEKKLTVINGRPTKAGWTGKLWAMQQGVQASSSTNSKFLLFTDADIAYEANDLQRLVGKARNAQLDMVSLMAKLRVITFWEKLLIPAFVYFFSMIYPFRWVNTPQHKIAAAAGGCILLRRASLSRAGGLPVIASELIDDCALAKSIKNNGAPGGGRIWLGTTHTVKSIRPYCRLADIWLMVVRSAFTQLNYSLLLLAGTVLGMILVFIVPALTMVLGFLEAARTPDSFSYWLFALIGLAGWLMMSRTYLPTLRWYGVSIAHAPLLPFIACLYTLMTIDSAWRFWRGRGVCWKDRIYSSP